MKDIKDKFKKSVCTSEFDLSNNDFNEIWINSFIKKPIFKSIILNNSKTSVDLHINFEIFKFPTQTKNNIFYKNLHLQIKQKIYSIWAKYNISNKPIYYTIDISTDIDIQFLVFFVSPDLENKHLAYSHIKQQNKILSHLFSLLFNINCLGTLNNKDNTWDVHNGCVYINPQVDDTFTKFFGYQIIFHYSDNNLKFFLKGQAFKLDDTNSMNLYEDICLLSKTKIYSDKINANTEFSSSFLNLQQNKHTLRSKFMSQYFVYKKLRNIFKNNFIQYQETFFTPTKLFNHFYEEHIDNNIPINIFINKDEKEQFNKICLDSNINDGFSLFVNNIQTILGRKVNVLLATYNNFEGREFDNNIYLMFGDKYKENYVHHKANSKLNEQTALDYYLTNNLSGLSMIDINKHLTNIDLYSSIKIRNLLNSEKSLFHNFVTQGLVLDISMVQKPASLKHILSKILGELNLKRKFFQKNDIAIHPKIQSNFSILETYLKIVKKIKKKTYIYYSYIKFSKNNEKLSIIDSKIIPEIEFKKINLSFPHDLINRDETIMVFDNKIILNVKDNSLNPRLIFRNDLIDSQSHDPIIKMKNQKNSNINDAIKAKQEGQKKSDIKKLLEKPVEFRRTDINENILFPYYLPTTFVLTGDKTDQGRYSSILIDDTKDNIKVFYHISNCALNGVSPKDSLIEEISLFEIIDDFEHKKVDCKNHMDLIEFYLSTSTFKLLLLNSVSKKTILRKFLDISLFN